MLVWSTEPGVVYQVQYKNNTSGLNWVNFGRTVIADGATFTLLDSTIDPWRIYRVKASLP